MFRSIWAIFIHSNVSLPLGPFRYLVGSPKLHRWHHANQREVGNYANLAPWLDVLFGTYHCPPEEPGELGTDDDMPEGYFGLLAWPVVPQRLQPLAFPPKPQDGDIVMVTEGQQAD